MENRVRLDFSIGRIAYERLRDLARRANYNSLVNLFQHGLLVMELIVSSYEEGYEFYRIKGDEQERILFVIGDEHFDEEEESDEPASAIAEVIPLFPS
jgi:hypothetical protein